MIPGRWSQITVTTSGRWVEWFDFLGPPCGRKTGPRSDAIALYKKEGYRTKFTPHYHYMFLVWCHLSLFQLDVEFLLTYKSWLLLWLPEFTKWCAIRQKWETTCKPRKPTCLQSLNPVFHCLKLTPIFIVLIGFLAGEVTVVASMPHGCLDPNVSTAFHVHQGHWQKPIVILYLLQGGTPKIAKLV